MGATIPTSEPSCIVAGDTVKWLMYLGDYQNSEGWSLSYSFVSQGSSRVVVNATTSGSSYLVTVPATTTALFSTGRVDYQGRVTNGTETYTVRTGSFDVTPEYPGVTGSLDARTHARKMLDLLEAQLESRASDGIESHNLGGASINLVPTAELVRQRDHYKAIVLREEQAEKLARGIGGSRNIYVRFR